MKIIYVSVAFAVILGCTERPMKSISMSGATRVYCWHVSSRTEQVAGYSFDDIGKRGYIPICAGNPLPDLKAVASALKATGISNIVLYPFYPGEREDEKWTARELNAKERAQLTKYISVERSISRKNQYAVH